MTVARSAMMMAAPVVIFVFPVTMPVTVARLIINRRAGHDDARRTDGRRDDDRGRTDRHRVPDDNRVARRSNADADVDSGLGSGDSTRENNRN